MHMHNNASGSTAPADELTRSNCQAVRNEKTGRCCHMFLSGVCKKKKRIMRSLLMNKIDTFLSNCQGVGSKSKCLNSAGAVLSKVLDEWRKTGAKTHYSTSGVCELISAFFLFRPSGRMSKESKSARSHLMAISEMVHAVNVPNHQVFFRSRQSPG
ncbi:unnamed protein product [Trypanosoma congolense IL3000]|uniref:WGS project CAEQ00000000 data, annotated contig 1813 n=1 Tax=Trypanosoma congolense (strain IL3000) TaxID=1068625 RepID=F9W942_TRYCI|nr:unnamed protein product [Trypanosoma congolense IL3000]